MTSVARPGCGERRLHVAEPCQADWDAMTGDRQRRFCGSCRKHVHDLSAMTSSQADRVLAQGDVCVRFRQDADGRVVHRPEPGRFARIVALGAALVANVPVVAAAAPMLAPPEAPIAEASEPGLLERMRTKVWEMLGETPESVVSQGQVVVMGDVAPVEPPPPPPVAPPEVMGRIAPSPRPVAPPRVVTPPLPTPGPEETVIPEVEEALRRQ